MQPAYAVPLPVLTLAKLEMSTAEPAPARMDAPSEIHVHYPAGKPAQVQLCYPDGRTVPVEWTYGGNIDGRLQQWLAKVPVGTTAPDGLVIRVSEDTALLVAGGALLSA
jgi:hypothetical protein